MRRLKTAWRQQPPAPAAVPQQQRSSSAPGSCRSSGRGSMQHAWRTGGCVWGMRERCVAAVAARRATYSVCPAVQAAHNSASVEAAPVSLNFGFCLPRACVTSGFAHACLAMSRYLLLLLLLCPCSRERKRKMDGIDPGALPVPPGGDSCCAEAGQLLFSPVCRSTGWSWSLRFLTLQQLCLYPLLPALMCDVRHPLCACARMAATS